VTRAAPAPVPAAATPAAAPLPEAVVHTLPNGVRALVVPLPHRETAAVSVFVRSGSQHEPRPLNGVGHVVEHMVFKGTRTRDAHRINLDAEGLGAEVNAHTDKDHSAFHLHGLAADAGRFVHLLADLLLAPTFPADELERERQVLLQEFAEDEDDPMATAYRLFDHAAWGTHPLAQPAIGRRANVERFTRDDLARWVERQFTGANLIVAAAGPMDPGAWLREVERAFGGVPAGAPNTIEAPAWVGGVRTRQLAGSSQSHLVLGWPAPPLAADDLLPELAAVLFGEGMSAPLMAELRESRGLVYYAACAADVLDGSGGWVIEASCAPQRLDELLAALPPLLAAQAERVDPAALARAVRQLTVRWIRQQERPARRLEAAALDLYALGRVRSAAERCARIAAATPSELGSTFAAMLSHGAAAGLSGQLGRHASARVAMALEGLVASGA
jgi:predicted Zn-dependent peptidase